MKKTLPLFGLLIVLVVSFALYKTLQVSKDPVHYHANFAVFISGEQVDFSKPSLMHIQPCTNDEKESSNPEDNVHLHDQVGNVVHLHADGINWHTFFSSIQYDLLGKTNGKTMTVYSKGVAVSPQHLFDVIEPRDMLLIHIASQGGAQNVSEDVSLQLEQKAVGTSASEYDEGKIGIEKCGTHGQRSLFQRFTIAFGL